MPTNTLTDARCKSEKPGDKLKKLFDGEGLFLAVLPSGSKSWRVAYRLDGKAQTHVIGPYPETTLAQAREARHKFKSKLSSGALVAEKAQAAQEAAEAAKPRMTLRDAAQTYWEGRKDITDKYRQNALNGMHAHLAHLMDTHIDQLDRDHLLAALKKMDNAGLHVYVRKVRIWAGHVWDWAIEHSYATINPLSLIRPEKAFVVPEVESFASLELDEVPDLWRRLRMEGDLTSVLACKMLAYTWVRTKEMRAMKWDQIKDGVWLVRKATMKKRRDHLVPMPRQAMQLLEFMKERSRGSEYVFAAEHRMDRPISENTVLALLYRLGYKGKMTGHGWRTAGSTWANDRGMHDDAIEYQLSHVPGNKTRAVYNRAKYINDRREILQAWADWLDDVDAGGAQGGKSPAHGAQ